MHPINESQSSDDMSPLPEEYAAYVNMKDLIQEDDTPSCSPPSEAIYTHTRHPASLAVNSPIDADPGLGYSDVLPETLTNASKEYPKKSDTPIAKLESESKQLNFLNPIRHGVLHKTCQTSNHVCKTCFKLLQFVRYGDFGFPEYNQGLADYEPTQKECQRLDHHAMLHKKSVRTWAREVEDSATGRDHRCTIYESLFNKCNQLASQHLHHPYEIISARFQELEKTRRLRRQVGTKTTGSVVGMARKLKEYMDWENLEEFSFAGISTAIAAYYLSLEEACQLEPVYMHEYCRQMMREVSYCRTWKPKDLIRWVCPLFETTMLNDMEMYTDTHSNGKKAYNVWTEENTGYHHNDVNKQLRFSKVVVACNYPREYMFELKEFYDLQKIDFTKQNLRNDDKRMVRLATKRRWKNLPTGASGLDALFKGCLEVDSKYSPTGLEIPIDIIIRYWHRLVNKVTKGKKQATGSILKHGQPSPCTSDSDEYELPVASRLITQISGNGVDCRRLLPFPKNPTPEPAELEAAQEEFLYHDAIIINPTKRGTRNVPSYPTLLRFAVINKRFGVWTLPPSISSYAPSIKSKMHTGDGHSWKYVMFRASSDWRDRFRVLVYNNQVSEEEEDDDNSDSDWN